MLYLMSGVELHPDFGFGITADSYYENAQFLNNNQDKLGGNSQVKVLPQNYLYRHSIELFLKSLIIIFHKKLEINYDQESFESSNPKILTGGRWRPLYTCHWIDALYDYWLNHLLLPNVKNLQKIGPDGDWQEAEDISKVFPTICKYDKDSSYFRYPVTNDTSLDNQKFAMKKFKADTLEKFMAEIQAGQGRTDLGKSLFLKVDEDGKITDAFHEDEKVLVNVTDALRQVAYYFHCIHIMTRMTLCGGM